MVRRCFLIDDALGFPWPWQSPEIKLDRPGSNIPKVGDGQPAADAFQPYKILPILTYNVIDKQFARLPILHRYCNRRIRTVFLGVGFKAVRSPTMSVDSCVAGHIEFSLVNEHDCLDFTPRTTECTMPPMTALYLFSRTITIFGAAAHPLSATVPL